MPRAVAESGIRCVIVDDHRMVLDLLAAEVGDVSGVSVAATATDVSAARRLAALERVDLLIVDRKLGTGAGMEVVRAVAARHPGVRCVVIAGTTADFVCPPDLLPFVMAVIDRKEARDVLLEEIGRVVGTASGHGTVPLATEGIRSRLTAGSERRSSSARRSALILRCSAWMVALLALVSAPRGAIAGTVYSIYGTGMGANLAAGNQIDQYWKVVALPVSGTNPAPGAPYSAPVPQKVISQWIGGNGVLPASSPQSGYTTSGTTYYWIGANVDTSPVASGTYTWIVAQDFYVSQAGTYDFDFYGTVDNELSFYVGGTVTGTNTDTPSVVGGTQIGTTLSGTQKFTSIHPFTGSATFLSSGTYQAYAVVRDWGTRTGVLVSSSFFEMAPVPEPSTSAMALAVVAFGGWRVWRRRRAANRSLPPPGPSGMSPPG